jgi:hypothetical protein
MLRGQFEAARPFPHIVIDDFLPTAVAEQLCLEFPPAASPIWSRLPSDDQKSKYVTTDEGKIPFRARAVIHELNSGTFLELLERITGIPELVPDTKLVGGGLHRIERGGKLSVHLDFSHHPTNGLNRRLNLLIYLNKDWSEAYGGRLELWSRDMKRCEQTVLPVFNRCVIFSTSHFSYHGHPDPLTCPEDESRKSIALYYFSHGRPASEDFEHNTLFRSRSGDPLSVRTLAVRAARSGLVRDLLPPVLYRTVRDIWHRRYGGKTSATGN